MLRRTPWAILSILVSLASSSLVEAGFAWSYDDFDYVLEGYVSPEGLVDYEGLTSDRTALDRFVEALGRTSPDSHPDLFTTEAERLAYWMNAYNALMLKRVVDAWPIDSVRQIKPVYGVFWMEKHTLGGERWTLRGLENKIIRRRFRDPRIHFAINCASTGCPALPTRAWRPDTLDADLDKATRRFIANPDKVWIDREAGVIHLSRIFEWFTEDFTGWLDGRGIAHTNGVLDYVLRYLPEGQRVGLDTARFEVEWIDYDWSVNDANIHPVR
jgi:hypothetical protein